MHAKETYQKRREREIEREEWNEQKRFSERTSAKGRKRMLKWKYKFSVHPNHLYYCEWEIVHSPILGATVAAVAAGVGVALYEFSTCLHHVGFLFPLFTFNQLLLISVAVHFFLSLSLCHFFPFIAMYFVYPGVFIFSLRNCSDCSPSHWRICVDDATAIIVHDDSETQLSLTQWVLFFCVENEKRVSSIVHSTSSSKYKCLHFTSHSLKLVFEPTWRGLEIMRSLLPIPNCAQHTTTSHWITLGVWVWMFSVRYQ